MNISKENRLLLYCAQTRIPEDTLNKVKDILSFPLNWEEVLESALSQGVAPLLCHNLKKIQKSKLIPEKVMDRLEKAYYANVARNMFFYKELKRILEAFHEKGVKVIVLKGPALDKTVYGDIGLRTFGDLDLLVKEEDLAYAKKVMSDLEYVFNESYAPEEWYRQKHFHFPYNHSDNSVQVEIHWHIMKNRPFCIQIDEWWERTNMMKIDNYEILIPSPEDMLIHLCLHLFKHGYPCEQTLRGLCDISETLRYYRKEINWQRFQDEVNRHGINKPVYSMLFLVKNYQDKKDNSLSWLEHYSVSQTALTLIEKRIFNDGMNCSGISKQIVQSLVADKFWDKTKKLLFRTFPPREEISKQYSVSTSSRKIYFFYLIRFLKYGIVLLGIFRLKKHFQ